MKIKSIHILFAAYIVTIIFFGFIYSNITNIFNEGNTSFIQSLFFSVTIITTLGLINIIPTSVFGMSVIAIEAIIGVCFIALFAGNFWKAYLYQLQKTHTLSIKKQFITGNKRKLKMLSDYLQLVFNEYRIAYKQLMTPLSKISRNSKLNVDFKYSELKYLMENSANRAVVEIFYQRLDLCNDNLRELLSNPEVFKNKTLHHAIISFLHLSLVNDPRNAVLSTNVSRKRDDEIETRPIRVFYKTLKIQYRFLKIIRRELDNMCIS